MTSWRPEKKIQIVISLFVTCKVKQAKTRIFRAFDWFSSVSDW